MYTICLSKVPNIICIKHYLEVRVNHVDMRVVRRLVSFWDQRLQGEAEPISTVANTIDFFGAFSFFTDLLQISFLLDDD